MIIRRSSLPIVGAAFVLGCDPAVNQTVQLTPSPAAPVTSASDSAVSQYEAIAAVGRIAREFGLIPIKSRDPRNCTHQWQSEPYRFRGLRMQVGICATPMTDGRLEVTVSEVITSCWSPKGESVRTTVLDSLARFGQVRHREGDERRSQDRCPETR